MYGIKDIIKDLNIPDSKYQKFRKVLFKYLKFEPQKRLSNNKIDLTVDEQLWIKNHIIDDCTLDRLSKEFAIQQSLIKYGCESPNQYIEKRKHTSKILKERGTNRNKYFNTCLERYGFKSVNSDPKKIHKAKLTCQQKYGGNSSACAGSVIRKAQTQAMINTKLLKYNTLNLHNFYRCDNLRFDSKLEICFYLYHKYFLGEPIKRGPNIEYKIDGKKHIYECDFQINNKLIEIKGSWLLKTNKTGLLYPFKKDCKSKQKLYDAKYKCMLENNVVILSEFDIQEELDIMEDVSNIYIIKNDNQRK